MNQTEKKDLQIELKSRKILKAEIREENERILAEREKRRKEKILKEECTGNCDHCKYAYYATDHGYAYEEAKLHCKLTED